jgi:hypothetical protein
LLEWSCRLHRVLTCSIQASGSRTPEPIKVCVCFCFDCLLTGVRNKAFAKDCVSLLLRSRSLNTNRTFVPSKSFELHRIQLHKGIVLSVAYPGDAVDPSILLISHALCAGAMLQKGDFVGVKVLPSHFTPCVSVLTCVQMLMDSASTIGEAINAVCDKLGISDCRPYAIYLVCSSGEESLRVNVNICDVVASVERRGETFIFMFKRRLVQDLEKAEVSDKFLWSCEADCAERVLLRRPSCFLKLARTLCWASSQWWMTRLRISPHWRCSTIEGMRLRVQTSWLRWSGTSHRVRGSARRR